MLELGEEITVISVTVISESKVVIAKLYKNQGHTSGTKICGRRMVFEQLLVEQIVL